MYYIRGAQIHPTSDVGMIWVLEDETGSTVDPTLGGEVCFRSWMVEAEQLKQSSYLDPSGIHLNHRR